MLQLIDSVCDSQSSRYGRLLNWQNPGDPFWHYGIGLSDSYIFDTGRGMKLFKRAHARCVVGVDHILFSPQQTIERLKWATEFFANWDYNVMGWNCEHLARLIATDRARCYQSAKVWWLCDMTPKGDHKTARLAFTNHLLKVAPHLVR